VSPEPLLFVRELLQNALDATRRRISDRARAETGEHPSDIRTVSADIRAQYPINLSVDTITRIDSATGGEETLQILTIRDFGPGMSQVIIERYFLQIGQSYYNTPDFRHVSLYTDQRFWHRLLVSL
jgi:HSP90 family molecular chaperone